MSVEDLPVKEYTQETEWSCGPAALKILLSHYGHNVSEDQLIELSGTTPAAGATHAGLINAAHKLGYHVMATDNAAEGLLPTLIKSGAPVLIDFQGASGGGHYVAAIGMDSERVHIEDPRRHGGNHYTLDWNLFNARWYNVTYGDKKFINRWLMAIYPQI